MKKTIILMIAMFLLLSSCGKSSKITRPADQVDPAGTQAPKGPEIKTPSESEPESKEEAPEIKTPSESETQSEETTENREEEKKEEPTVESSRLSRFGLWVTKKAAKGAVIVVTAYGLCKLAKHVTGEKEWNQIWNQE